MTPAVLQGPDQVDETLWQGLDFLLDEMAKRDMKAVLYLNNFWQWSGGMSQYVAWSTGKPVADPDVTGDWNTFIETTRPLFTATPKAQEAFRFAVKQLVARKNSVNGRMYSEDPTIMSWQLANEPRPGSRRRQHAFRRVREVDRRDRGIHQEAGAEAAREHRQRRLDGHGRQPRPVREVARHKNVDYLTFHMWAPNWGWFDPKNAAATYDGAWTKMQDYLNWHIDTANKMGKPIVLEEFGINRDDGSFRPGAPTTSTATSSTPRSSDLLARRAAAGDAIAGSNFWAWGGAGRTQNADFMWKAGDGFVGRSAAGTAGPLLRVRLGRVDDARSSRRTRGR